MPLRPAVYETDLGYIRSNLEMANRFKSISSTASMAHCRKANERLLRMYRSKIGLVTNGKFVPFGRLYSEVKKQLPKLNQRLFEKVQFGLANPELHDTLTRKMMPKDIQEAIELVCQNITHLFGFEIHISQLENNHDLRELVQQSVREDLESIGISSNHSPNELTFVQEAVIDDVLHIADAAEEIGIHFDKQEYLDLGRAAEIRGNLFTAERYYREVMKQCLKNRDSKGEIDALCHISSIAYSRGDLDELHRLNKLILSKSKETDDSWGKFVAYSGFALRFHEMGDVPKARLNYSKSQKFLDEMDDDFTSAGILLNLSLCCVDAGDFVTAENMINNALQMQKKLGRMDGESKALSHMASLKGILGNHEDALRINLKNLEYKQELEDAIGEAGIMMEIGVNYHDLNQLEIAKKHYIQSLKLSRKIGHRKVECASLGNLGRICMRNSEYQLSERYFQDALQIAREVQNCRYIVTSLQSLGILFRRMESFQKAEKYFTEALEVSTSSNLELEISSCYHSLGILYRELGDLEKSLDFMQKTIHANETNHHDIRVADTYKSMGLTLHELDKSENAIEALNHAITIYRKLGRNHSIASCLRSLARVHGDTGQYQLGKEALLESLDISIRVQDRKSEALCFHELGFLEWKNGNDGKEEQYYLKCLEICRAEEHLLGEADVLRDLARNAKRNNSTKKSKELLALCNEIRLKIGLEQISC